MDIIRIPEDDVLSAPTRARLFAELVALRRPASTVELARRVDRHPNTVRLQLRRLALAGLVESRHEPPLRGRPRHLWAVAPGARPGGAAPRAHADLSRWLARAMPRGQGLTEVEAAGREIGRELAPPDRFTEALLDAPAPLAAALPDPPAAEQVAEALQDAPEPTARDGRQAMQDALTALGFAPRSEAADGAGLRYVLGNCPYREAVAENPAMVCSLHRGITRGLLERLDPGRRLTAFVPKDPFAAGCVIEVQPR